MGEIIIGIVFILLATFEARFPTILFPSIFIVFYILWIIKTKTQTSHIILLSFILGIVLDSIDTSHVWLYPIILPFATEVLFQIKQKVNLSHSLLRLTVFTLLILIIFFPHLLYYDLPIGTIFLRSLLTAIVIEGVLILLWKGELS